MQLFFGWAKLMLEIRVTSQSTIWFYSFTLVFLTTKLYCHAHYYNCNFCYVAGSFFAPCFRYVEFGQSALVKKNTFSKEVRAAGLFEYLCQAHFLRSTSRANFT